MFNQIKDIIKVYIACFDKGNYINVKRFSSLLSTCTNLSKNEVSKKKRLKYTTPREIKFLNSLKDDHHNLAIINFIIYMIKRNCIVIESPKDISYNTQSI